MATIRFKLLLPLIGIMLLNKGISQAQELLPKLKKVPPVICFEEHNHLRTPKQYAPWSPKKEENARIKSSNFVVSYDGVPSQAQQAFNYATIIWEGLISSQVDIHVSVIWDGNMPAGTLASSGAAFVMKNFSGAPKTNIYYPGPLAEKLSRQSLNSPSDPDIVIHINSAKNWYFDTFGEPGVGQYDFVTVCLHEICHGLGFNSSFLQSSGIGRYGVLESIPYPIDLLVHNGEGVNLYQNFFSPSATLGDELTGNNLFFLSDFFDTPIKIYAPKVFNNGSSLSHLDRFAFSQGTPNALMRPAINIQEVNHNPGTVAPSLLNIIGWTSIYIEHEPVLEPQEPNQAIEITALVEADDFPGYGLKQVDLIYYTEHHPDTIRLPMSEDIGNPNEYRATIPPQEESDIVYYLVEAIDNSNLFTTSPAWHFEPTSNNQLKGPFHYFYSFPVGSDVHPPIITHTPKEVTFLDESFHIEVDLLERTGLSSVQLDIAYNDEPPVTYDLNFAHQSTIPYGGKKFRYTKTIPLTNRALADGDLLQYTIKAVDNSPNNNESISGEFTIPVKGLLPATAYYWNDFERADNNFIGTGFLISIPNGFSNPLLHSLFPYPEAGSGNEIALFTVLRHPIIIGPKKANLMTLSFDEIVLVEPGKNNSNLLYDYVIVEGSPDGGKTWMPLSEKYDSRSHASWQNHFEMFPYTGNGSLFHTRTVQLLDFFEPQDEVLIRFRLFSDPFANGWGWGIDNILIQNITVPMDPKPISAMALSPNPLEDDIATIHSPFLGQATLHVVNAQGQICKSSQLLLDPDQTSQIDLSNLRNGFYMLKINFQDNQVVKKLIIDR